MTFKGVSRPPVNPWSLKKNRAVDRILSGSPWAEALRMDGIAATWIIKNRVNYKKVQIIIALTAYAMEGDKEKFLAAGLNDYVSKP